VKWWKIAELSSSSLPVQFGGFTTGRSFSRRTKNSSHTTFLPLRNFYRDSYSQATATAYRSSFGSVSTAFNNYYPLKTDAVAWDTHFDTLWQSPANTNPDKNYEARFQRIIIIERRRNAAERSPDKSIIVRHIRFRGVAVFGKSYRYGVFCVVYVVPT